MAQITPDRFNPIKAYCNVRLQQGVPLVDADINELDDIRKFEVRAFLKWCVGDGVPEGNDGFRIEWGPGGIEDFQIRTNPVSGTEYEKGLHAGRCIVDGLDVMIFEDTSFKQQPLHPSQKNALSLARSWDVPVIDTDPLTHLQNSAVVVAVYLDVWERLVTPTEDRSMILPGVGETCARRKREWVVRVAIGNESPSPAREGHSHYLLATIVSYQSEGSSAGVHYSSTINDCRQRGLSLTAAFAQLSALKEQLRTLTQAKYPIEAPVLQSRYGSSPPADVLDGTTVICLQAPTSGDWAAVTLFLKNYDHLPSNVIDTAELIVTFPVQRDSPTTPSALSQVRIPLKVSSSGTLSPKPFSSPGGGAWHWWPGCFEAIACTLTMVGAFRPPVTPTQGRLYPIPRVTSDGVVTEFRYELTWKIQSPDYYWYCSNPIGWELI